MKAFTTASLSTLLIMTTSLSFAQPPREIMKKVNERKDGTTQFSKIELSTCRYTVANRKIKCIEKSRVKIMESVRKDFGPAEQDSKSVITILEPAGERGIGFLQFDWDDPDRETDQWMYFSALGKVKRIISGNEDEPKTGSFFGTEITYEDIEARHLDDYTYKLIGREVYQERDCWVIQSTPTPERLKKSNYSKSINWIDKERYLTLKSILFNQQGRRLKRITNSEIKKINEIWVMRNMLVNNLETKRLTTFRLLSTAFDFKVDDQFFTQRTLTDSVFREQNLKQYRLSLGSR